MILHYLTVAFRNLRKYKSQTLISVVGLAVGFTCFAMAVLWIRYEMSYDSFHKNADRIYCVSTPISLSSNGINRSGPYPLAAYLRETFPEVIHALPISPSISGFSDKVVIDGVEHQAGITLIDSSFFSIFDVGIIEGSMDFTIPRSNKAAITREKALALFGEDDPVGRTFKRWNTEYTVCAIVTGLPGQSNYAFDILAPLTGDPRWNYSSGEHTLIELASGVDLKAFATKLREHKIKSDQTSIANMTVIPLKSIRYTDPHVNREVKFEHIKLFALAGVLVILCTLFNYLTLFVSRFRIRQKELALRRVCGASGWSLLVLLSVEFILTLLIALLFGLTFIQTAHQPFQTLSQIRMELSSIYGETLLYIAAVIAFSLLTFWTVLAAFRRRTLNSVIRQSNKNLFRKASVVVQLIISIGFAFCSIVIVKQMYHLHNVADLGFDFKNRAYVTVWLKGMDIGVLENQIRQIPEVTEAFSSSQTLIPVQSRTSLTINEWDGKEGDVQRVNLEDMQISEQFAKYYGLRLLEGDLINDADDEQAVLINESAAKAFGWNKPVGKQFHQAFDDNRKTWIVKGLIKDIHNFEPTARVIPFFYRKADAARAGDCILFRYAEGRWKECRDRIERLIKTEYPDAVYKDIQNAEENYDAFLKSENALLKLLSFVSLVCVIICIFGFVSLVSLTCEERRKEIAIRKINGATAGNILGLFIREYFLLLVIGAVIAFPIGYYIMRQWIEKYVKQTGIPAWIYLSILTALVLSIALCVGWRVYKASVENPADVVK
ncbi:MAG: ABC transporter permease [Tannerella sp.]|jgi:ABC-type antimicrobial peptide transport system permease subunit|nr:ABC transporter permease [Tannerella sp.]